jgi:SpoU rRNA methylase family enzyme
LELAQEHIPTINIHCLEMKKNLIILSNFQQK